MGILGTGSGAAVTIGSTATASWKDVAVVLVESVLSCLQTGVTGVLGASLETRDAAGKVAMNAGRVAWNNVTVVAATSNVSVRAGIRAAVIGASADTASWDDVFVGAAATSRFYVRVGSTSYVMGAPGSWNAVVVFNDHSALDANSSVLWSNHTVEALSSRGDGDSDGHWLFKRHVNRHDERHGEYDVNRDDEQHLWKRVPSRELRHQQRRWGQTARPRPLRTRC